MRNLVYVFICLALVYFISNAEAKIKPSPAGGGYVEFNSDDDFLSTVEPFLPEEEELKTLTVEAWIYLEKHPDVNTYWSLFGQEGRFEVVVHSFSGGTLGALIHANELTNVSASSGGNAVALNRWVHVVAWYSPSAGYGLDGVGKPWAIDIGGQILMVSKPFRVGGLIPIDEENGPYFIGQNTFFRGYIDEVRISKVLRHNDLPVGYEVPKERFTPDKDTICLWHFDEEPTAHRHDDASGNGWYLWKNEVLAIQSSGKISTLWGKLKTK